MYAEFYEPFRTRDPHRNIYYLRKQQDYIFRGFTCENHNLITRHLRVADSGLILTVWGIQRAPKFKYTCFYISFSLKYGRRGVDQTHDLELSSTMSWPLLHRSGYLTKQLIRRFGYVDFAL